MAQSILNSTKKKLGLEADYTVFDEEIIDHINSVLGTLNQIGIGPDSGFMIEDDTKTWDDFTGGDPRYNPVMAYIYLRVRLLWDPPALGFVLTSMQQQREELEVRLNYLREELVHPYISPIPVEDDLDIDGGSP